MSSPIRLVLVGSRGRMGQMVKECLENHSKIHLVSEIPAQLTLEDFNYILEKSNANVLLDFTCAESAIHHAELAFKHNIAPIIGTTGIDVESVEKLRDWSEIYHTPGMWVPNFSLTAVLLMHCAELVARWIPNVEIVEYHHAQKADAPSGTAIQTARKIASAQKVCRDFVSTKEMYDGALGACVEGVPVHSVRLKGLLAHQEVIFGAFGESLTLRYDNYDRKSYFSGIELAVLTIVEKNEFIVGLENLLI